MHQTNICPEAQALSGSLKPYIGTDNEILDDDEKAFLQAILDDDNRIKAQGKNKHIMIKKQ